MALKVWHKRGMLHAECTDCGSYGTAGHSKLERRLDPEIAAALEQHTARMLTLREHMQKATTELSKRLQNKELTANEASAKYKELAGNHVAQVRLATARLPNPAGKTTAVVAACPWCDHPAEAEIEYLESDAEIPFSLVKLVVQNTKKGE